MKELNFYATRRIVEHAMSRLIGTGRMNRSGSTGTLTVPVDLAHRFDLDVDGVDVVYLETDSGDVVVKPADQVEL